MYSFVGCRRLNCRVRTLLSAVAQQVCGADKKLTRFGIEISNNSFWYIFLMIDNSRANSDKELPHEFVE